MDPMRLTLLRHGHAQPFVGEDTDFVRRLTERGIAEAGAMGARLARAGWIPELILASPAQRTRSTAERVAEACAMPAHHIRHVHELYQATAEDIWRIAVAAAADAGVAQVLVCGHNPGLSRLASRLGPRPTSLDLPPAGVATARWARGAWDRLDPGAAEDCEILLPERQSAG